MPDPVQFVYRALNGQGASVKGLVAAQDQATAFDVLKARGLSPLRLKVQRASTRRSLNIGGLLSDREISGFTADLAAMLRAGADMRTALAIVAPKSGQPAFAAMVRQLSTDISGGGALDRAFAAHLPARHAFIAALVSAGEASGDLAGGLERASEMMENRLQARDQLVSILSYPLFVLLSAIVALFVILLLVVPSLAPLAPSGAEPGGALKGLLFASRLLRENLVLLGVVAAVAASLAALAGALGLWAPLLDRLFMQGPLRKLAAALTYGGFAVALGGILGAGAPMSDALKLAIRTTRSGVGQKMLQPVLKSVRQGEALSAALGAVKGFPHAIVRLATIGEQSGALGPMLVRAGRFEEKAALRSIESSARIIGPLLIVLLGGLIGLLMAGLLSGISGLGDLSLQGE